jgi:tetratricopeptide (TPR) repeat protein
MSTLSEHDTQQLHEAAYAAMQRGELDAAARQFSALVALMPDTPGYHYMLGLAHKYRRDWAASLHHNLQALALYAAHDEAASWNAAIAATALGDWAEARRQWTACGIALPEGDGPIAGDFGTAVVRLHPWSGGETLWMRRIDPVRARLLNVPLPESGHRFGDIVLHDGASTGTRQSGGRQVPVFNALQRLAPSDFQTFVAFVRCDDQAALDDLLDAGAPGLGYLEDWSAGMVSYCMRCSYGTPHSHGDTGQPDAWEPDHTIGIAAQSRRTVETLLNAWTARGEARHIEAIEQRELPVPAGRDGHVWWRSPDDADNDAE